MIYSCFNQNTGLYRYFEDSSSRAVNSDLPVPSLRGETQLGYPAIEAARPLPSGAKPIGSGWHARGIQVRCNSGLGGLGAFEFERHHAILTLAALATGFVVFKLWKRRGQ